MRINRFLTKTAPSPAPSPATNSPTSSCATAHARVEDASAPARGGELMVPIPWWNGRTHALPFPSPLTTPASGVQVTSTQLLHRESRLGDAAARAVRQAR